MKQVKRQFYFTDLRFSTISVYESYFRDMAKQGWLVKKLGKISVQFEKGNPQEVNYRILCAENHTITQTEKMCFITSRKNFGVFSSNPQSEMDTEIPARATVQKRMELADKIAVLLYGGLCGISALYFLRSIYISYMSNPFILGATGKLAFLSVVIHTLLLLRILLQQRERNWKAVRRTEYGFVVCFVGIFILALGLIASVIL